MAMGNRADGGAEQAPLEKVLSCTCIPFLPVQDHTVSTGWRGGLFSRVDTGHRGI